LDEIDDNKQIMNQLKLLNGKKDFNHYAPARFLLQTKVEPTISEDTLRNFELLFEKINKLM
jgi:5-methylcytosine-specific restriction endonuclease McrBC regulatory subunit McrC